MHQSPLIPGNLEALVTEYKRLWPLLFSIHARIGKLVGQAALKACAKRLGMIDKRNGKKVIAFTNEFEADIFQDYLLYMYRPHGISLIRQMHNRKLYPQGSEEQQLLEAMGQARFSAFLIEELAPAAGCIALDVVSGEQYFIVDQTIPEKQETLGLLVGFRIFKYQDLWMHTGASLPVGKIEDPTALQPMRKILNEKEERDLNELNIFKWREMARGLN